MHLRKITLAAIAAKVMAGCKLADFELLAVEAPGFGNADRRVDAQTVDRASANVDLDRQVRRRHNGQVDLLASPHERNEADDHHQGRRFAGWAWAQPPYRKHVRTWS